MRRQEPVLLVTAVLCLCILIEDVAMILVFDSSFFAQEALLPLYISERYNLTAREREILKLVLEGKDNQNIASTL
jgi:DNA-binding NarL/FixJ family response regulator